MPCTFGDIWLYLVFTFSSSRPISLAWWQNGEHHGICFNMALDSATTLPPLPGMKVPFLFLFLLGLLWVCDFDRNGAKLIGDKQSHNLAQFTNTDNYTCMFMLSLYINRVIRPCGPLEHFRSPFDGRRYVFVCYCGTHHTPLFRTDSGFCLGIERVRR